MTAPVLDLSKIDELREQVAGDVFVDGDEGFAGELAGFNLAITHAPLVAVGATGTADVCAAVSWAAANSLSVAVQATGHGSFQPYADCLLINTSRMTAIEIDEAAGTARVAAGVRWREVIDAAAPFGLAPLNGSSSGAGAVGYTTGGGLPLLGRTFGFAADNVTEFELVTADGIARRCAPDAEPDLFWAVRGGKGNFGIVTSLTVRLMPVSRIYGGAVIYDGSDARQVLAAYRDWVDTLPNEMNTSLAFERLPDLPFVPPPLAGKLTVHLLVAYVGDAAAGERLLAPIRGLGAPVLIDSVQEMSYTECDQINSDPADPLPFWGTGAPLAELPDDAVDALLAAVGPDADIPIVLAEIRQLGGALARQPEHPNAISGRGARFLLSCVGLLMPGLEAMVPAAGRGLVAAMQPWIGEGLLVNFLGDTTSKEEVAAIWSGPVYDRLLEIKARVDPANLFRHGHALDPGSRPGRG